MNGSRFVPLVLLALFVARTTTAADITWRTDYAKALREASATGKPMIVVVGTEECHWCRQLETRTFSVAEITKLLNERFVVYKLDANRQPELAMALRTQVYPSMYYASPSGNIVGHQEGFLEAEPFRKKLVELIASVGTPESMQRDYELANKAVKEGDQAQALKLLRQVLEDGKNRPVQVQARKLIDDLEIEARGYEAKARDMVGRGRKSEAMAELMKLDRSYPGTPAAREGKQLLLKLTTPVESDRAAVASDMLELARRDYRSRQFLACLDRCEAIAAQYGDTNAAIDADKLAIEIKANPEWSKEVCDQLANRLGSMYLSLAETYVSKGNPEQAVLYLERVATMFPGSRNAELARMRLLRLKDVPTDR
ncbi:MAG: DUF255 domain-containing protein [Planctomycetia bacterium]|nr:DUF255 domain-containing protein [Planctomycetia bacterium]